MTTSILAQIDDEISRLTQVRNLLFPLTTTQTKRGPGRPPNSSKKPTRYISPQGRARISAAVKAHWAAKRKDAAKKGTQKTLAKAA